MTEQPPAAATEPPFEHRPVMRRRDRGRASRRCPPASCSTPPSGAAATPRRSSPAARTSSVVGVDRDPEAARRGRRPPRPLRRPVHRRPRPLRRPRAGSSTPSRPRSTRISGALFDLGVSSPQFDRGRARLLLPARRSARHAHGPHPTVVGRRRRQRLRRRRPRPGHPPLRRRALRRAHRQGDRRRPPDRVGTAELAEIVRDGDPGGDPPPRRPSGPAHVPGDPRSRSTPSSSSCRAALDAAIDATVPGGRIAVLSYHSGEDRIVKDRFRRATGVCDCPPDLPCVCGARQRMRLVRGIPRRPSDGRAGGQSPRRLGAAARRRAGRRDRTRRCADDGDARPPRRRPAAPAPVERRAPAAVARRPARRRRPDPTCASCRAGEPRSTPRSLLLVVVVALMLAAVVLHTRLDRAATADRPARAGGHRGPRALRRAPRRSGPSCGRPPASRWRAPSMGMIVAPNTEFVDDRRPHPRQDHRRRRHGRRPHRRRRPGRPARPDPPGEGGDRGEPMTERASTVEHRPVVAPRCTPLRQHAPTRRAAPATRRRGGPSDRPGPVPAARREVAHGAGAAAGRRTAGPSAPPRGARAASRRRAAARAHGRAPRPAPAGPAHAALAARPAGRRCSPPANRDAG